MSERRFRIVVCRGPECGDKRDSQAVHAALTAAVAAADVGARCVMDWQTCFGRCSQGPNVLVREVATLAPPRLGLADLPTRLGGGPRTATALYNHVAPVHASEIVASHVGRGVVVRHLIEPVSMAARGSSPSTTAAVVLPTDPVPSLRASDDAARARPDPLALEVVLEDVEAP